MKRPEGFDPPGRQQPPPPARKPARQQGTRNSAARNPKTTATPPKPSTAKPSTAKPQREQPPRATSRPASKPSAAAPHPDALAKAELKRAARERKRFERAEVRRFTRRSRNRRITIAVVAGTVVTLVLLVLTAVFSPILALRQVSVDGTSRINAEEVVAALDDQLGTPLALIDFGKITQQLGAFPLIRSYVTETVPPDKLIIHIVERQPVGSIKVGDTYRLIDPAGVTVQESPERIAGVPLIDIAGADMSSPAFSSVVEVLLALPATVLGQVDTISAHTQDDVALVLTGVGQRVTWGSADDSVRKAALLSTLIAITDPALAGEFDVSAPSNPVFRPAG